VCPVLIRGLAKMLVGAKSWQKTDFPEYGRFTDYGRKEVGFQVEVLLQQGYLELDSRSRLVPVSGVEQGGKRPLRQDWRLRRTILLDLGLSVP
jgi:hypothetical protein